MQLGNCIGWAIHTHRYSLQPLVVLVPPFDVERARYFVAVSLPSGSVGTGRSWRTPQGRRVTVVSYLDDPLSNYEFDLVLCCGGKGMGEKDMVGIRQWRETCHTELQPWEL